MLALVVIVGGLALLPLAGNAPALVSAPATGAATEPDGTVAVSSTTSTTVTGAPLPSPLPITVSPSRLLVGPGEVARITGTCPSHDGRPLGPVVIWEVGATVDAVTTAITDTTWSLDWRSPPAADVDVLQVWCGDPATSTGGYPAELQIEVVYVAQDSPAPAPASSAGDGQVRSTPANALPASR